MESCLTYKECETPSFLGAVGICNVTTELCECPDGYSGKDDWMNYNDCHVSDEIAFIIRISVFALTLFITVFSLVALCTLGRKWGFSICHILGTGAALPYRARYNSSSFSSRRKSASAYDSPVATARLDRLPTVDPMDEPLDGDTPLVDTPSPKSSNVRASSLKRASDVAGGARLSTTVLKRNSDAAGAARRSTAKLRHPSIIGPEQRLNDTRKQSSSQRSQRSVPRQSLLKPPKVRTGNRHRDELTRKSWRRQRNTLIIVYFLTSFGLSNAVMYLMFYLGYNRQESIIASIGLATATSSVFFGLWGLASVWYYSLPNVELFGRLFAPKHLLVRRPNFVKYATIGNLVAINICTHGTLWIAPLILGPGYQQILDKVYLGTVAILEMVFCIILYIICSLLTYCFHKLSKSVKQREASGVSLRDGASVEANINGASSPGKTAKTPRTASAQQSRFDEQRQLFREAKFTVHIAMWGDMILGPCIFGLLVAMIFVRGLIENVYITFGLVILLAALASIITIFVFLCRSTGPGYSAPSKKDKEPSEMEPL